MNLEGLLLVNEVENWLQKSRRGLDLDEMVELDEVSPANLVKLADLNEIALPKNVLNAVAAESECEEVRRSLVVRALKNGAKTKRRLDRPDVQEIIRKTFEESKFVAADDAVCFVRSIFEGGGNTSMKVIKCLTGPAGSGKVRVQHI